MTLLRRSRGSGTRHTAASIGAVAAVARATALAARRPSSTGTGNAGSSWRSGRGSEQGPAGRNVFTLRRNMKNDDVRFTAGFRVFDEGTNLQTELSTSELSINYFGKSKE
eukprot:gene22-biopygen93